MADLLSKNTILPIHEVENETIIMAGNVYLIPPKKNMTISNRVLHLKDKPKGFDLNLPIDIFFKSLAEDQKENSIGIVLSGTGSDGTRGIRAIKEHGGMIMVQKPNDAKFDGMPNSAIATGLVDYILPVNEISSELDNFINHPKPFSAFVEDDNFLFNKDFNQLISLLFKKTNIDFSDYKLPTLLRRVVRRMSVTKSKTIRDYINFTISDDNELDTLYKEFLIGVTKFFRDVEAFEIIEKTIIPELFKDKKPFDKVKIWSVGCSSGEEAYSLAILIKEYIDLNNLEVDVKIFATDLDKQAIQKANIGAFTESIVADVSIKHLKKYFVKKDELYHISPQIRRMIIFSQHNIAQDPPFTKMDLITCRNLLIYLQSNLQQKIIGSFHYSLKPDKFLFLGPSEAIGEFSSALKVVSRKWRIYKNVVPTKTMNLGYHSAQVTKNSFYSKQKVNSQSFLDKKLTETLSHTLLEETGAASAFVDKDFELISADVDFNRFFKFPEKKLRSFNIFKILPQSISLALSTALRKAEKESQKVIYKDISVGLNSSLKNITLIVKPVKTSPTSLDNIYLIIFLTEKREGDNSKTIDNTKLLENSIQIKSSEDDRIFLLEQELSDTKANLQSMVEEIETSNEELQATNEELLASNEELQSTNEELQSVNEELYTVNSEYQEKIDEIAIVNSDLENLIKSTEIGTIFLDDKLNIRRFTPHAKKFFNILDNDLGRPITHFNFNLGNINYEDFLHDLNEILTLGKTSQKEVTFENKWFLKRTNPFFNAFHQIKGVVISFIEITEQKKLEQEKLSKANFLEKIIDVSPNILYIFNQKTSVNEFANKELAVQLGYTLDDIKNMGENLMLNIIHPEDLKNIDNHHKNIRNSKDGEVLEISYRLFDKNGEEKWYLSRDTIFKKDFKSGEVKHIGCAIDITEIKKSEEILLNNNYTLKEKVNTTTNELNKVEAKYQKLYHSAPDMFVSVDPITSKILECNQTLLNKTGYTREEIVGTSILDIYHSDSKLLAKESFLLFASSGEVSNSELKINKKEGGYIDVNLNVSSVKDENGNILYSSSSWRDISALKNIMSELEELTYASTHDIKAPINNISSYLSLLKDNKSIADKPSLEAIYWIEENVKNANKTLNNLMSVAKARTLVLGNLEGVSIEKAFQEALITYNSLLESRNIKISSNFKDCKTVLFSESYLISFLSNLLSNAIKYQSKERDLIIDVFSFKIDGYHCISVRDNGIGINLSEDENLVFGLFKRASDQKEGSGLALYLMRKILNKIGSKIEVKSELKEGSTFTLYFKN